MTISILIQELQGGSRESIDMLDTDWCAERLGGLYTATQSEIEVHHRAHRAAEVIEVAVRMKAQFAFRCSRCAEPAELAVEPEFTHHFVAPGSLDAGDEASEADMFDADPDVSEHDGERLELQDLCVEHILLELPAYPICSEQCRGLCLNCGTNLNEEACACASKVDPFSPWAVLANLKADTKTETPS